jgi:hypothetical protein
MLLHNWSLTHTLLQLSRPERARTTAAREAQLALEANDAAQLRRKEDDRMRVYAEAYEELEDFDFENFGEFCSMTDFGL